MKDKLIAFRLENEDIIDKASEILGTKNKSETILAALEFVVKRNKKIKKCPECKGTGFVEV